tara:strand:+ start:8736 stop:8975 length:240 start_codon:yes stop_codon:yes gene_type:complete
MTKEVNLILTKRRRGIYETEYKGQYIDFYKLPSDGLWRTSYFPETRLGQQTFSSMKIAKMVVEKELQEKHEWLKAEGYA